METQMLHCCRKTRVFAYISFDVNDLSLRVVSMKMLGNFL